MFDWLSGKAGSKAVDAIINAGDALVFTDEEKSKVNMAKAKLMIDHANAMSGSRLSRRYLVWAIMANFFVLTWLMVGLNLCGSKENYEFIFSVIEGKSGWAFVSVVAYYFLAPKISKN